MPRYEPKYKKESKYRKRLTNRERQVLQLMANDWKSKNIAEFLRISVETVKEHRKRIYQKLGAHTAGAAVARGMRRGDIR